MKFHQTFNPLINKDLTMSNNYTQLQADHLARAEKRYNLAENLSILTNKLYRENNIITTIFDRSIVNNSINQITQNHQRAKEIAGKVCLAKIYSALQIISESNIKNAQIDIGRLAKQAQEDDISNIIKTTLENTDLTIGNDKTTDVVLYGFGRIGRILTRLILEQTGLERGLKLKGIVVRKSQETDLSKRVSLFLNDSVHGQFNGTVEIDQENEAIIANGQFIKVIYANNPAEIDYTQYGIDNALVIDNTGKWRDEAGLSQHLQSKGVAKVLLTAPGKGDMKNIVFGVNDADITSEDKIISAASCTTNAITPALKVLNDNYGIVTGHVETIHSYTNDQNLIDNYHKADRRGRSASLNMVITETGAAKAVAKALPELKGKLTGNSVRVPTPNVSLAILNVTFEKTPENAEAINSLMQKSAYSRQWSNQIDYTTSADAVSTDFVGAKPACIYDAKATIATGNQAHLYLWYDNEVGYSCQVLRIAQKMAGIVTVQI